jgi:hypothetical protein
VNNQNATLAALCVFNGLKLSPVVASPDPRFALLGDSIHPRFNQCANYLTRFFTPSSTVEAFCPLEVFNGALAIAPWLRGAVGMLQHTLNLSDGIDVPDVDNLDPAIWFEDLHEIVVMYRLHSAPLTLGVTAAVKVQEHWEAPDFVPVHRDSRAYYLASLYAQARAVRDSDAFLVSAPAIARARQSKRPADGQRLPFPDQVF